MINLTKKYLLNKPKSLTTQFLSAGEHNVNNIPRFCDFGISSRLSMRYCDICRFFLRYYGICQYFLRYCGVRHPPMSPSQRLTVSPGPCEISCGVPQGSILWPPLFLYINDLCNVSKVLVFILFAEKTFFFCFSLIKTPIICHSMRDRRL